MFWHPLVEFLAVFGNHCQHLPMNAILNEEFGFGNQIGYLIQVLVAL
ncbi:hypothetical protein H6G00_00350 [Leptolyngbya sp. FACHB-541]|nr:hypothetical protein [Leptolyngbya sp. FACHB-541]MBD1995079.1 hypothetical protein [Leptolyngbya sp. FACHB-541]